jgi:capsular exopolysaccharide synthesis family protein
MAEVGKPEAEFSEEKLHFLDYWRVVRKRKEIIIAILFITVSLTAVLSTIAKDTFSAYSLIKVEQVQRPMDVFGTEPSRRFLPFDQYEFETHRRLLESNPVIEKVVTGEIYGDRSFWRCRRHPQFALNRAEAEGQAYSCKTCGSPLEEVKEKKYPNWERLDIKWARRDGYPGGQYPMKAAVAMLRANLKIRPEKGTRLITIRYESHDKEEARLIADMVAEAYVQCREEQHNLTLQRAMQNLQEEIRTYQYGRPGQSRGLEQEEADLINTKLKLGVDAQDQLTPHQQLVDWRKKKDEVTTQIAQQKSEIEMLEAMDEEELINASHQENSAIDRLAVELGIAEAQLSDSLSRYGEGHLEVIGRKRNIESLKKTLSELAKGVLEKKKAALAGLKALGEEFDGTTKRLEEQIAQSEKPYTEYIAGKNFLEVKRNLLWKMQESQIEERITNAIPRVDIQLAQRADPPGAPVSPRPVFNVIVSLFVGLTLGTGIAYFVEYLDTSMKTVDDVERYLNVSTLAVIPQQKEGLLIHETPKSHAAENYRMLWTNIEFARKEDRFKNIMITSGGAAEGKTTTVVNLGIAAAQMGAKVLLVDSDLRRPKIHKLLRYSNRQGLSDVLLKGADPREVLITTEVPGLWAMPSGKLPSNVIGLLNSQKMKEVIATLSKDFDVLLYDSPPVMGVSDASVMASVVDRVLLVIDYRKYPKRLAMRAKRNLENVGGRVLGGVINNLNVLKEDYYYYGYGYGKAYHYYYARSEDEEESEEKEPAEGAKTAGDAGPAFDQDAKGSDKPV